jgi:hypothetical protein
MLGRNMRRFGVPYVEGLLAGEDYGQLAELSAIVCGSDRFAPAAPDYGLPPPGFLFVEAMCWFAQAERSGAWTYYEATPRPRQEAMARTLRTYAPAGYADWYECGMADWEDEERMRPVDQWTRANTAEAARWLREFARQHREVMIELTA